MGDEIIINQSVKDKIHTIRGLQVMLDNDLAELYEVETKRLNEQVRRNIERFPEDFMFQLTEKEKEYVVANCDHLKHLKFSYQKPYVFTEQGVAMLSGVLRSKKAIEVNIHIMRAFIAMRKFISSNAQIFQRLDNVETRQLEYHIRTDKRFEEVFKAIEDKDIKPDKGIFFDGQIFDAYVLISDIIKGADRSIILIDNYVDESVLTLFSKRKKGVSVRIYTKSITDELKLDLKKYNSQHEKIEIEEFSLSHDRFLIIDKKEVYHIGASLKDLGNKWFAFSKLDTRSINMLEKLNQ